MTRQIRDRCAQPQPAATTIGTTALQFLFMQEERPLERLREVARRHSVVLAGTFSGVVQAGLFNPYDRALYLSVRDHLPFLHRSNFMDPFRGFAQAVVQRTIAGGLYFVLQVRCGMCAWVCVYACF
jgi:hypothetical protein